MNLSFQIKNLLENESILMKIKKIAEKWKVKNNMFLLGKGKEEYIAKEGALKLKEVSYIHAEGYSSSALKHGPFALIEPGLPIIILDVGKEHREKNQNAYNEVKSRNVDILFITDDTHEGTLEENVIQIETNTNFGGILANIILQILSYEISLLKNIHPDYPRNLAKVVTVE